MIPTNKNSGESHEHTQTTPPSGDYQSQYEDDKTSALLFRTDDSSRVEDQNQQPGNYGCNYGYNSGS